MAILTRAQELTGAYLAASPLSAGALTVITDRSAVEARARDLQAKLGGLGITDVTQEGTLILGGPVEITPGLRKGVAAIPNLDTSIELDLDTLPELFDYTQAGRRVSTINADGAMAAGTAAGLQPAASLSVGASRLGTRTGAAVPRLMGRRRLNVGRTLVMLFSPVLLVDEALIVADELQFQDGTELIIANHVKYLTIIAQRITVGSDVTISWEGAAAPDRGAPGKPDHGTDYQRSTVTSVSSFNSPSGGDGGGGGLGGDGGNGGFGGRGGNLNLYLTDPSHEAVLAAGLTDNRAGGPGGESGGGGSGGSKGFGGEAGDPTGFWCSAAPERAGTDGTGRGVGPDDPRDGDEGDDGPDGPTGNLTAVVITPDEFRVKWTAP